VEFLMKKRSFILISLVMALVLSLVVLGTAYAFPAPMQVYYVPLPEADAFTAIDTINNAATAPMYTYFSISIALDGTYVYYDQWEDGYAADLANPTSGELYSATNLDGVQIWGNGEADDGCAPNIEGVPFTCSDANDVLNAGDVIIPYNTVDLPRVVTAQNNVLDQFATVAYNNQNGNTNWSTDWVETGDYTIANYRDEFNAAVYNNTNGSIPWSDVYWTEENDDGSATGGTIYINTTDAELRFRENSTTNDAIQRTANLSGYTSATLSFNLNGSRGLEENGTEAIRVQVSGNGGASWTSLQTFNTDPNGAQYSFDISSYMASNTAVRFIMVGTLETGNGDGERWRIDNLNIAGVGTGTSPSSGDILITGGALRFTETEVDDGIYRDADLSSGDTCTTLLFTLGQNGIDATGDNFIVEISGDGGANYIGLETFDAAADAGAKSYPIDAAYRTANFRLRFRSLGALETGEYWTIDNARVEWNCAYPLRFDGRDKVGATYAIAMARSVWASSSGTLNAFAQEMHPVEEWGTAYEAPVGANTGAVGDPSRSQFEYSTFTIMAAENNTTVEIDANADGTYETSINLNQGEAALSASLLQGARLQSDKPVQVTLLTGDINDSYESRDLALLPVSSWGNNSWSPVGVLWNANPTRLYLYNLSTNGSIYITCERYGVANTTLGPVAARGVVTVDLGAGQGARCFASTSAGVPTGDLIFGIGTIDTGAGDGGGDDGSRSDWGVTLYPDTFLTTEALVGLGLGKDPTDTASTENGSPLWVTAACSSGSTYVYVDWNNDGVPDDVDTNGDDVAEAGSQNGILVDRLQSVRLFEPPADEEEYDQSGARIWSRTASGVGYGGVAGCKLAIAWGQDPNNATAGAPGMDVGTSVPPMPVVESATIGNLVWLDENGDGHRDAGEAGIANVTVQLWNWNHTILVATTTTDTEGNYIFTNVVPGEYQVDVSSLPGGLVQTAVIGGTADNANKVNPFTLVVSAGKEAMYADFGFNWAPFSDTGPNPPLNATGAIGDRVWIDDGDHTQELGEPGLGGISVTIYYDPDGNGVYDTPYPNALDATGSPIGASGTTTTDAAGNYIFDGLPAGAYVVVVNGGAAPNGYSQTGDPDLPGAACGTACDNRSTAPVILGPGDVYLNVDFGYTPTGSAGNIADTVWLDADLDGTLDAGEPLLAGVTVALIQDTNGNGVWDAGEPIIARDITDASGQYLFTNLPADNGQDYLVWVNDTENVLGDLLPTFDSDGTGTPNISAVANLTSAGNLDQDFAYAPYGHDSGDGLIGDTIFLDSFDLNNFNPGEGLQGVKVELYQDLNADGNWDTGEPLLQATYTNQNGQYFFGDLPAGNYVVKIDTSTLPAGLTNTVDPDTIDSPANESGLTLTSPGGMVNLLQDFGYRTESDPNTISGTIWQDTNADGTLTESERFQNVTVVLRDSNGNTVGTATTDSSGNYSFTNLPDGTYTVDVTDDHNVLDGYWHSDGPSDGSSDNSQDDPYTVTVGPTNRNDETADFGYYRKPAEAGNTVWLDLNGDGDQDTNEPGLRGIPVTLTINYANGNTSTVVTITDANGHYSFGNLLLDENQNGQGTSEPVYTVAVGTPPSMTASPEALGGSADQTDGDSDGASETVTIVEGETDVSYDFGFDSDHLDMGDLPDNDPNPTSPDYPTYFSPGPAHVVFPDGSDADSNPDTTDDVVAVWLGMSVDTELEGQPNINANGDGADENGLVFRPSGWLAGGSSVVTITVNSSEATVVHYALWIDWDRNGSFADLDDGYYEGSQATASPQTVRRDIAIPAWYDGVSDVYMRLRASNIPIIRSDVEGSLVNGEVEDYVMAFDPTAVEVVTLSATSQPAIQGSLIMANTGLLLGAGSLLVYKAWRRRA